MCLNDTMIMAHMNLWTWFIVAAEMHRSGRQH